MPMMSGCIVVLRLCCWIPVSLRLRGHEDIGQLAGTGGCKGPQSTAGAETSKAALRRWYPWNPWPSLSLAHATSLLTGWRRDIRRLADVAATPAADDWSVEVRIRLDGVAPPEGELWRAPTSVELADDAGPPVSFTGWLGLLRALSEVIGTHDDDGSPSVQ